MSVISPEVVVAAPASPEVVQGSFEEAAQTASTAFELVRDYGVAKLLEPLRDYFPDAQQPLHAVLSISHIYDYPVEEIVSVIVDVENKRNPLFLREETFDPYDAHTGLEVGAIHGQVRGKPVTFQFGEKTVKETLFERPLPDDWQAGEHSAAEWTRRAEIAEDITIYLAHGARKIMHDRSPANLFDAAQHLKPFWDYGKECTVVADLSQACDNYREREARRHQEFIDILHEPDYLTDIPSMFDDEPFDEEAHEQAQRKINGRILSAWRRYSERSISPEEWAMLEAESAQAKAELQMMARYALRGVNLFDEGLHFRDTILPRR